MNYAWSITFALLWLASALVVLQADECQAKKSWAEVASAGSAGAIPTVPQNTWSWKQQKPSEPGVYSKLPLDAQVYSVRNVYDGDTLTLTDGRRVRLLGIDTPELEERQAFAVEAKHFTKDHCHKQEIYLSFDPKSDKQDRYGRLVANVWVQLEKASYLCVNEGLVASGLATVYLPTKESKPTNFKTLLKLQKLARQAKTGIWSTFSDYNVWVTKYGSAFHQRNCRHIAQSRGLRMLKASVATDEGLHPCRTCLADK